MKYYVGVISHTDALSLNDGLNDDDKTAFQNEAGTEFYIKDPENYPTTLPSSKYVRQEITQAVVDGSFPVTKGKRIYP